MARGKSDEPARAAPGEAELAGEASEDTDADDEAELEPDPGEVAAEDTTGAAEPLAMELIERAPGKVRGSLAKTDPLAVYMQEAKRYPLLTREEEHDLAVKLYEDDDVDAARRLVTSNLRLVVKIAHDYRRAYRNLLDLVQEGNIGLLQAVKKYDPYRGVKLSSYAAWWIRAYILKFILNNWRMVKIGTTQAQRKLFFNLRKEKEKLEQMGFAPDHKLLAARLDVTEKEVIEMDRRLAGGDMSLDIPVSRDEEGGQTRMDMLSSEHASRPDVAAEAGQIQGMLREKLQAFGATLKGREKEIFDDRLLTDEPVTLQELGDRFGVSRERTRQLEKRLVGRLRTYLEEELGGAVDIGSMGD